MQRDGNILSRVLRDGWDGGGYLGTLTKHSPARATGAHISTIGQITETELLRSLDRTEMANGFANRFLFASVRRSKYLPFGGDLDDETINAMAGRIQNAVTIARAIDRVVFSADAARGWNALYKALSEDRPGLLGALTARAEAQVVRLALLYALWAGSSKIDFVHLRAAIAVWEYCYASVEYLFGDKLGDTVGDALLSALREAPQGLSRTQLSGVCNRNVPANQIARALEELDVRGLAETRSSQAAGPGRPTETWFATS